MEKLRSKIWWRVFIVSVCCYVGFFILDFLLLNVKNAIFTALYGYFLFFL